MKPPNIVVVGVVVRVVVCVVVTVVVGVVVTVVVWLVVAVVMWHPAKSPCKKASVMSLISAVVSAHVSAGATRMLPKHTMEASASEARIAEDSIAAGPLNSAISSARPAARRLHDPSPSATPNKSSMPIKLISVHDTNDGAKTSMFGTHVLSNDESTAACSLHVPAGDDVAINPCTSFENDDKHSTRPANRVVVAVVVGVVVTVVVVVEVLVEVEVEVEVDEEVEVLVLDVVEVEVVVPVQSRQWTTCQHY